MSPHTPCIAERLQSARAGSREGLGQTLQACRRYLHWLARHELDPTLQSKGGASDLVQETFLDAERDFGRFHGNSEAELLAWLRRILLNNLANFVRRYRLTAKRRIADEVTINVHRPSRAREALVADARSPCEQLMQCEESELVQGAIARLPDDYRRVLHMWQNEERSFEEIGQLLNCAPNTARLKWFRAIQQLQGELESLR